MSSLPTETITHDGTEHEVSYEEWYTCGDCGNTWEHSNPDATSSCPQCGERHNLAMEKRSHFYMKFSAIPIENPPNEAAAHAAALRETAAKFEALEANDWEITQSDGVHIYFVKPGEVDTSNPHEIDEDLN